MNKMTEQQKIQRQMLLLVAFFITLDITDKRRVIVQRSIEFMSTKLASF